MYETRTIVLFPLDETKFESGDDARKAGRFDGISMSLHWLTVLLVMAQFVTALVHEALHGPAAELLLTLHRSSGIAVWTVAVLRLMWRRWFAFLPPFPEGMPKAQQWTAKLNEYGLYLLLLIQPVTGLAASLALGRPFALFLWQAPALMMPGKPLAHMLKEMHETGGWILAALIGLHAAAALYHALVLRDRVLQRMLPL